MSEVRTELPAADRAQLIAAVPLLRLLAERLAGASGAVATVS
jgi:hypothetical protein